MHQTNPSKIANSRLGDMQGTQETVASFDEQNKALDKPPVQGFQFLSSSHQTRQKKQLWQSERGDKTRDQTSRLHFEKRAVIIIKRNKKDLSFVLFDIKIA